MNTSSNPAVSYFAQVVFRDRKDVFGILQKDRMLGMYLLGKTGTGKSNLLKTLMVQDMSKGRGFCLLDVNGDLLGEVLAKVPEHRKVDMVYLNASDPNNKMGYNPLKKVAYEHRALIASSILETFQMLWGQQAWGIKLEYILRNVLMTLLDQAHSDFSDVPRILLDASFRADCLRNVVSNDVREFWTLEYVKYSKADILPVLNKVRSFLAISALRRILVENTNQLSLRDVMDEKKILLVNLSKGSIGVDGAHLLGSLLLTSLSSASLSRIDTRVEKRTPFFLYLDEFQNYTTGSIAGMLSELRKFGLGFVLANQYLGQLRPDIKNAVLGNIGTIICFRLGQVDARYMAQEFHPVFESRDFTHLENFHIYLRMMINGRVCKPFSAKTIRWNKL
jgi:Type IV secretion-system coupling protein DNA-binding domain